ncbi:MAG: hypothetical protein M5U28_32185 [Sandaracinaceae bacterium]|nr:hypothetical protein [Sandaracinaceae bacterium]
MRRAAIAALALCAASCEGGTYPPERLSAWGLFADGAAQRPVEGVVPYEIISPLFSDYAAKHRFIRIPEGESIGYTAQGDWVFPAGTVLVKTFGFLRDLDDPSAGEHVVETRLLVLEDDGEWHPYVYLWDEDTSDAVLTQVGARVDVAWTHTDGAVRELEYRVPNAVQCANCHGGRDPVSPSGRGPSRSIATSTSAPGPRTRSTTWWRSAGWPATCRRTRTGRASRLRRARGIWRGARGPTSTRTARTATARTARRTRAASGSAPRSASRASSASARSPWRRATRAGAAGTSCRARRTSR